MWELNRMSQMRLSWETVPAAPFSVQTVLCYKENSNRTGLYSTSVCLRQEQKAAARMNTGRSPC